MNDTHTSLGVVRALWRDLLRGALRVVSIPATDGYELLLAAQEPPAWSPSRARRQAGCEAVLRGEPQKAVAADLGVAPATLSGLLKSSLSELGLDARFSRIPIALPLLAHAAETSRIVSLCEIGEDASAPQHWHLSLSMPDQLLARALSDGERAVTARYLAGETHEEIAAARGTSVRTIANQLGSSFKKLGASGRFGLISALAEAGANRGTPVTLSLRSSPELSAEQPASCSSEQSTMRAMSA